MTAPRSAETGKVHPAAEIFPMMTPDELQELAADIVTHGLLTPIVLDDNGMLIDGRNRLAACELAGVDPTFTYIGEHVDPLAFILSANIARRHLTKGQQAMATALLYPLPEQGKRSDLLNNSTSAGPDRGSLSKARAVLANAPELAALVMDGSRSLAEAHETVRQRLAAADSDESKMAQLRARAPDVADLVVEGNLSLAAGMQELTERARQEQLAREFAHKCAEAIETDVMNRVLGIRHGVAFGERVAIKPERIEWLAAQLMELASLVEEESR